MTDPFKNRAAGLDSPAENAFEITPADGADLSVTSRGIYVGATGDLTVILVADSSPVSLTGIAAGMVHPLRVKRVLATGTTATGLVGLY